MRERESSSAGSVDWNGEEAEAVLLKQDEKEVIFYSLLVVFSQSTMIVTNVQIGCQQPEVLLCEGVLLQLSGGMWKDGGVAQKNQRFRQN